MVAPEFALALMVVSIILAVGVGLCLRRLGIACLTAIAFLAVLWILANQAIATGWHDADGFIDCGIYCAGRQEAVAVVFWYAPVIAGILLLIALVSAIIHTRRQW
jgi:hypothetical protein